MEMNRSLQSPRGRKAKAMISNEGKRAHGPDSNQNNTKPDGKMNRAWRECITNEYTRHKILAKSAGKGFRDGAVVPFE
jgi:hypothetical protein